MADQTGNYMVPFVISGVFIVACGLMLSLIPLFKRCKDHISQTSSEPPSPIIITNQAHATAQP